MSKYRVETAVLKSRTDVENVLDQMQQILNIYGVVTVADFYDLCGMVAPYAGNIRGWTDISGARIERCNDGYSIEMPNPILFAEEKTNNA